MNTARDAAMALRFVEEPAALLALAWDLHAHLHDVNESEAEEFATQLDLCNPEFRGLAVEAAAIRNGVHLILVSTSAPPRNLLGVISVAMYGLLYGQLDSERAYHVRNELLTSLEAGEGWLSDLGDKIEWRAA